MLSDDNRDVFLRAARPLGEISRAVYHVSDPHNGGKSAVIFETERGKYVYKPRPPATDIAFTRFLQECGKIGLRDLPACALPLPESGDDYTIVPFIESAPARSVSDVHHYYACAGTLLALAEVLGATDLHGENLIAVRDAPVIVDTETLLTGAFPDRGQYQPGLNDSLLYSHLLPNWALDEDENHDIGALSGEGPNRLLLEGKPCFPYEYISDIRHGFTSAYGVILSNREAFACALRVFDRARLRKLLRPTEVYGRLCDKISLLENDAARMDTAGRLRRAYERDADPMWAKRMERVCRSEIDAVLRGDIPYFYTYGNERALRDHQGVVCEDYYALSPVDHAIKRLGLLSESDKSDQTKIIAQSFSAVNPCPASPSVTDPAAVFDLLEAQSLANNPCSWIGIDTDDKGRAYLQSIGFDLYNGLLGVLCFYAALYEATGDKRVKEALEKHYQPYEQMYIDTDARITARADNINLTHGLGGHLLAHAYIARCLSDGRYRRNARKLFSRFEFSQYCDAVQTDVYGGASGLLIALPTLDGGDEAVRIAICLADIVRKDNPALTGYAHGAAGEALALAAAQTVIGEKRYENDILRMLKAENSHYDPESRNWPDLRDAEKRGFMNGLCSGAPGIGLARRQMLEYLIGDETRDICMRDVECIREYFRLAAPRLKRDSLCCGNAARIEGEKTLLGCAASALNDPPVFFRPLETDSFPADLFQGWAGVGYALTRRMPSSKSSLFLNIYTKE